MSAAIAIPATPNAPAAAAPSGAARALGAPATAGAVTGGVRRWLRAEGVGVLAAAVAGYAATGWGWGFFALLFLAPDLSFVAYAAGRRAGTAAYNALHSYVGPLALGLLGHALGAGGRGAGLLPLALVWAAHIGFDRAIGYGLKYPTGFGHTHLGRKG